MVNIENLNKVFGNKTIFCDASLSLPNHGLFIIRGDNGVGKTTLLNILGLIDSDYLGEYSIDNNDVRTAPSFYRKNYVCYLSQKDNLVSFLTPKQNYNLDFYLGRKKEYEDVDSQKWFDAKKISSLSDGEKIQIVINREKSGDKKLFLLDEVSSFLDRKNTKELIASLEILAKERLVLIATHDSRMDYCKADGLIAIKEGLIIQEYFPEYTGKNEKETPPNNPTKSNIKGDLFFSLRLFISNFWLAFLLIINVAFALTMPLSCISYETIDFRPLYEEYIPNQGSFRIKSFKPDSYNISFPVSKEAYSIECTNGINQNAESSLKGCANLSYCGKIGSFICLEDNIEPGFVYLSTSYYSKVKDNENQFSGDYIRIYTGSYFFQALYKIKSTGIDDGCISVNAEWFNELMPSSFIFSGYMAGGMWENSFTDLSSLENCVERKYLKENIRYVSQTIFEKNSGKQLGYSLRNSDIVLGTSNLTKYRAEKSHFPSYKKFNIPVNNNCYVDLNDVFDYVDTKVDLSLSPYLDGMTVIVSDNSFLKMKGEEDRIGLIDYYTINKRNRNDLVEICTRYHLVLPECYMSGKLSSALSTVDYDFITSESVAMISFFSLATICVQSAYFAFVSHKSRNGMKILFSKGLCKKDAFLIFFFHDLLMSIICLAVGFGFAPYILHNMMGVLNWLGISWESCLSGILICLLPIGLHMIWLRKEVKD